jgi:hypothetical protein
VGYCQRIIGSQDALSPDEFFASFSTLIFWLNFLCAQRKAEWQLLVKQETDRKKAEAEKSKKAAKPINEEKVRKLAKIRQIDPEVASWTMRLVTKYPVTYHCFDVASITGQLIDREVAQASGGDTKGERAKLERPKISVLIAQGREVFREVSAVLGSGSGAKRLPPLVANLVQIGAAVLSQVRILFAEKLASPPPKTEETEKTGTTTGYERSMRFGLRPQEKDILLDALVFARSCRELLQSHSVEVTRAICDQVAAMTQDFAMDVLPKLISSTRGGKNSPSEQLEAVRYLLGLVPLKSSSKYDSERVAAPQASVLDAARVFLEIVTNPSSAFSVKGSELEAISGFLEASRSSSKLLTLMETIDEVFDQSFLYFKEAQLSVASAEKKGEDSAMFFPVATSLPVILTEYALEARGSKATNVFYPLSIYDDAAAVAVRKMQSTLLWTEIKAEAEICIMIVTRKIADAAFHPILRYCATQNLDPGRQPKIEQGKPLDPNLLMIGVLRVGGLLQQNELSVLGRPINTQALIAERTNELIASQFEELRKLLQSQGLLIGVSARWITDVLRAAVDMISRYVICDSYDQFLGLQLASDTPNSVQSRLLEDVASHALEVLLPDFTLMTGPLRLFPAQKTTPVTYEPLFQKAKDLLDPIYGETHMVTMQSCVELFRLLGDGASARLFETVTFGLREIFADMVEAYQAVAERLVVLPVFGIATAVRTFDRYEGAYRHFLRDPTLRDFLVSLKRLGNALGLMELMDLAFETHLSRASSAHVALQLKGHGPPTETETGHGVLARALGQVSVLMAESSELFAERSRNLLELHTLTSWGARWAVVEFVFALWEGSRTEVKEGETGPQPGALEQFGEGVLLAAAVMLVAAGQEPLYRLASITARIRAAQQLTGFAQGREERLLDFLAAARVVEAVVGAALVGTKPVLVGENAGAKGYAPSFHLLDANA